MKDGTRSYFLAWPARWSSSHLLEIFDRLRGEISNPQRTDTIRIGHGDVHGDLQTIGRTQSQQARQKPGHLIPG